MTITERMTKLMKTNVVRTPFLLRGLAVVALAGAMFTTAAPKAEAQRFAFGVRVGGPVFVPAAPVRVYGGPIYGGPVYGGPIYGGPVYGGYGYRHDDWRFRHDHDRHGWR